MIWFGSSAGVALASMFPQARSVGAWIRGGWHVTVGYLVGFFCLVSILQWHPDPHPLRVGPAPPAASAPR